MASARYNLTREIFRSKRVYDDETGEFLGRTESERRARKNATTADQTLIISLICPTCESDKLVPMPDGSVRCRWVECGATFASLDVAASARGAST